MKVQIACLSLAAIAAVTTASANAADWNGGAGSIKDMSGSAGIPVPAPVPIPEYKPSYYFRLDAGLGTISQPSISEDGYSYGGIVDGANGYPGATGPVLQTLDPTWLGSDFSTLSTFGGGIGYYFGGGWRMDASVEKRSNDQVNISGSESWDSHAFYTDPLDPTRTIYGTDPGGDLDGDGDGGDLNGDGVLDEPEVDRRTTLSVNDQTSVDGTIWMANMYYDLGARRGFTPYIGGGVGFIWNQIERTHNTTITSCALEDPCGGTTTHYNQTFTAEADTISLAAAAMAGFSYQVTEITSLDIGYRYLYLGGTDFVMNIDGTESRVTIGDQHSHQFRAGLRFDVN
ncbi:MAG: opacity family porin [Hyphomicrobium sp.]